MKEGRRRCRRMKREGRGRRFIHLLFPNWN
jgi:hypothetical protein